MYDFNREIERKGTNCVKWDSDFVTDNVMPMWIADMDFEAAPAIVKSLQKTVSQGVYGYTFLSEKYYQSVMNWMIRRHEYKLEREEISFVPNVVIGLSFAIQSISEPGDEILVPTPVYGPFFSVVNNNNRILVESPMKNEDGYYTMDFEDLESRITPKTKAVMLCNPHNPSGRVWTHQELEELAAICIRHRLYIISDDIHSELIPKERQHEFIALLSKEVRERTITFTSPSKAFNLAGIHVANAFIHQKDLRDKFNDIKEKSRAAEENVFAEAALTAAYNESEEWLDELNVYLEENIEYFVNYIQKNIPQLKVYKPEGTYLVWVDCRGLNLERKNVHDYLLEKCHIVVNDGEFFGEEGKGFARFNLACPRKNIEIALENLKIHLL